MKTFGPFYYSGGGSPRQQGDLLIPDEAGPFPLALCIHGGGWASMNRSSLVGVAEFLCEQGWAAFNIDYRLLDTAPWPACGDDCLAAARFLLAGGDQTASLQRDKLLIVGASAGGHLALMTGLRLPRENVYGMVSISGIADLELDLRHFPVRYRRFWDHEPNADDFRNASPLHGIYARQPPCLCTHCPLDNVVDIAGAHNFVDRCRNVGAEAELFEYERHREEALSHCIWIPGSEPHRLYPEIEEKIKRFIQHVHF